MTGLGRPGVVRVAVFGAGGHAEVLVEAICAVTRSATTTCHAMFARPWQEVAFIAPGVDNARLQAMRGRLRVDTKAGVFLGAVAQHWSDEAAYAQHVRANREVELPVLAINGIGWKPSAPEPEKISPRIAVARSLRHGLASLPSGSGLPAIVHPTVMLADRYEPDGFAFAALSGSGRIGAGAQVLLGGLIATGVVIGDGAVVNTGASVDHDCRIGTDAFIGPGAVLCGGVTVGDCAFVGAGATVLPGITLGEGALVPAGSTVTRDVPAFAIADLSVRRAAQRQREARS